MLQRLSSSASLRVLDLADRHGHFAGKLLAQLGAEVVRIEPPDGHPTRRIGPYARSASGQSPAEMPWLIAWAATIWLSGAASSTAAKSALARSSAPDEAARRAWT